MKRVLVVYYSRSANTRKLAGLIQRRTGGALFEIEPMSAYPSSYNAVVAQAKEEIQSSYRPPLKAAPGNIGEYDTIFVGTPNWWSTMAPPVATFLASHDLSGKTVVPFCTHGGGGSGHIERDIAKLCPNSTVTPGLFVYEGSASDVDASEWLKRIGVTEK